MAAGTGKSFYADVYGSGGQTEVAGESRISALSPASCALSLGTVVDVERRNLPLRALLSEGWICKLCRAHHCGCYDFTNMLSQRRQHAGKQYGKYSIGIRVFESH